MSSEPSALATGVGEGDLSSKVVECGLLFHMQSFDLLKRGLHVSLRVDRVVLRRSFVGREEQVGEEAREGRKQGNADGEHPDSDDFANPSSPETGRRSRRSWP